MSTLDLFAWLTFAAILWMVRELLLGLWAWRKARQYIHVRKVERTRGQFASIRNELSRIVANNGLGANSGTFKRLYLVNTVFMRSPDRYPELCDVLHQALLEQRNLRPSQELLRESKTWRPEVQQLVIHTADAMQQVLVDYSFFCRVYFRGADKKAKFESRHSRMIYSILTKWLRTVAQRIAAMMAKKDPFILDVRKAQDLMYQMARRGGFRLGPMA